MSRRLNGAPARGRPCPVAGRSLRPSWAPVARSCLRSAILAPLVSYAGSEGSGQPRASPTEDASEGGVRLETWSGACSDVSRETPAATLHRRPPTAVSARCNAVLPRPCPHAAAPSSDRRARLPGSPNREVREYARLLLQRTVFPRLAPRASRQRPSATIGSAVLPPPCPHAAAPSSHHRARTLHRRSPTTVPRTLHRRSPTTVPRTLHRRPPTAVSELHRRPPAVETGCEASARREGMRNPERPRPGSRMGRPAFHVKTGK
jgi:hypothetical protein